MDRTTSGRDAGAPEPRRRPPRSSAVAAAVAAVVVLVLVLVLAACSKHGDAGPPFPGVAGQPTTALSLGHGISILMPAGWTADPIPNANPGGTGCAIGSGYLSYQGRGIVRATLIGRACSTGGRQKQPLNGFHGNYLSAADAFAPRHVTTAHVGTRMFTVFDQAYTECTNSCRHSTDTVGLVRLATPPAPQHPVLMLTGSDDEVSATDMKQLLASIR